MTGDTPRLTPRVSRMLALACMLTTLVVAGVAAAQGPPALVPPAAPAPAEPALTLEQEIAANKTEVTADLERVRGLVAASGESPPETLVREQELLERLSLVLEQQSNALRQRDEAAATLTDLQAELVRIQSAGPAEKPPYSLLTLDSTRDELQTLQGRTETTDARVTAATAARELARKRHEERETDRRRAKEAREAAGAEADATALVRALRMAELESRIAAAELRLRKIELEHQMLLKQTLEARVEVTRERERWISSDVVFTYDDLQTRLVELEAREEQIRQRLDLLNRRAAYTERAWFDARARLEAAATDDGTLAEEVAARRLAFQVDQREVSLLTRQSARIVGRKETWRRRFEFGKRMTDRETVVAWEADAGASLAMLATDQRLQELELRDLARDAVTLGNRLANASPDAPIVRWIREQLELTKTLQGAFEANIASIDGARRLEQRLLSELGGSKSKTGWKERVTDVWASVVAVWQFEVTSVDDSSISVGKIVVGVGILVLGFSLSRFISGWLGRRILPRFGLDEGAAAAIRSVLFYILLVCFVVIGLRTINIPLTAFTILGGAIAIGIGFGSQNIMNNFMSGLIMLAERPVRVGDLIQLGDLYGSVQHIGARSTRVLTGNNIEIVVPNSSFLENNVINWTLSETRVRIHVTVGVAYGSPTREVTRLLLRAVQEHGRVLKTPTPIVLFTDFGDNALHFEIHFWIVMRKIMDRRVLESDIRYRIDGLFHEAGIVIAFPQRDVHLDTTRPLPVHLTRDPDADALPVDDEIA